MQDDRPRIFSGAARATLLAVALFTTADASTRLVATAQRPTPTGSFAARNFTINAEDFNLTLTQGTVVMSEADGVIRLGLIGRGVMRFSPAPESEKSQIRLLTGTAAIDTTFDTAVVQARLMSSFADLSQLAPDALDARTTERARQILRDAPTGAALGAGDLVADVKTGRFGTLTYLRSEAAAEDISLFNRATSQVLSVYSSSERIATRGPFLNDDDLAAYDVLHHNLDLSFAPERHFIQGVARMRVRVRSAAVDQLAIRLADTLTVRDITSPEWGVLPSTRVPGRDTIVVTLPRSIVRGTEATIAIDYSGRIDPPAAEWELPDPGDPRSPRMASPTYLTSTFPMWYPRPPNIDYATAVLRITVPAAFTCIATGELSPGSPALAGQGELATKTFVFTAAQPIRHVAFLATTLMPAAARSLAGGDGPDGSRPPVTLTIFTQPGAATERTAFANTVADLVEFYRSIVGDMAYPHLTVALIDGQVPGGHTVAYFSAVGRTPSSIEPFWRSDPAAFDRFPNFVAAHEIAHQWWGQAVGWGTYHDQWMTEAFAQYFAALYTEHTSGEAAFRTVLGRMRTWAIDESSKGPLSLGPRLGQIQNDDRVFRALLYNKGPLVLHMLRLFIGDEAFFTGIRQFYATWRFGKPSTSDLRTAMEHASGRPLERFFEQWVEGTALPQLRFSARVESGSTSVVVLRVEQTGDVFDLPITAVVHYRDRYDTQIVMRLSERVTETRVPLEGRFRRAELKRDDGVIVTER